MPLYEYNQSVDVDDILESGIIWVAPKEGILTFYIYVKPNCFIPTVLYKGSPLWGISSPNAGPNGFTYRAKWELLGGETLELQTSGNNIRDIAAINVIYAPVMELMPGSGGGGGPATDHSTLTGRSLANAHPVSAITGLQTTLDTKYSRPSSGIPATDLAAVVQSSLSNEIGRAHV